MKLRDIVKDLELLGGCADLDAAGILFNGAVHYICMINDIGDTSIDPDPTVQLFLRSIKTNHE